MANPTITINATGITVSGPLIAGEPLAVTASGLSLPEDAALTLALSSRAPNALLASCVLAESEETPGTWTGTLETASRQMAVYFATAAADDTRPAVLELVETTTRDSLALLVTSIRNSALIPSSSPCAVAPVYLPIPGPPGPPGQGGDPYDQAPLMDGVASAGTSDDYARGDHRHPTDTSRASTIALFEGLAAKQDTITDLASIRSGAAAGATAVQPAALSDYRTASAQDAIDGAQDTAIAAKYTKPATGIPASDLAAGVIPSAPSASDATPLMDGTGAAGTATTYARGDHQHPSDTAKVNKSGDTMTGALTVSGITTATVSNLLGFQVSSGANAAALMPDRIIHNSKALYLPTPDNNGTLALQEGIAPAFSASSTYAVGDYVTHEGLLYKCTTAVSTAGAWNAANWSAVAVTDEMGADTPLPFDAECEYITIPAGAYILPEVQTISPEVNLYSQIKISSSPSASAGFFIGNWSGAATGSSQILFNAASTCSVINGNNVTTVSSSGVVGQFGVVALQGNKITIGATTSSSAPNTAARAPLDIGIGACVLATGGVDASTITGVQTDIASFVFRSGGAATRDFVPVRIGTVGYLYDKISGRLFWSAVGSIPLIPGPDKAQPTITTPGRIVELTPAIRYAFASPTHSVSGTAATVACEDRAVNDFTVATGITSLTITPPAAVTGRARDFFCRVTLTDASLPTVTLPAGQTVDIGQSEINGMTQGINLLMFTEISSGHWLASRRSAS